MSEMKLQQSEIVVESQGICFSWEESPPIKQILDSIIQSITDEYIYTLKNNPTLFLSQGTIT